jgi:hypothetical protein
MKTPFFRTAKKAGARVAIPTRTFWVVLAVVVLAIGAAGTLSVHVIVSTGLLRGWVNGKPEELLLAYDQASSWIPGVIRIRGLTMRGSDPNVQWSFRMEKATISISLVDLFRRHFHATRVRAEGLVFRLREKEKKNETSAAHAALLPPIAGFSDPPLQEGVPEPPAVSKTAHTKYWTVRVDDLVADPAPDIWVEIYRFRGRARVTGGFTLHPHDRAKIGPAAVEFLSGNFLLGPEQAMLSSASGRGDCDIDAFNQDAVRGNEVWRRISGNIRVEGRLEDLRFLNHFLRDVPEPRLSGGGGKAHGDIRFDHGIASGRADFELPRASFRYARETVRGRASGLLKVPRWDVEHDAMEISGSRIALSNVVTTGTAHDERDWWGRFDIPSGRIQNGLSAETAVSCRDARPLYTLFGANLPGWAEGILKLEGLKATGRVRLGSRLLDMEDLEASGGKFHIAGRYRQKGEDRHGAFLVETGILAVGISIDGPSSKVKIFGAKKWFAEQTAAQPRSTSTTTAVP